MIAHKKPEIAFIAVALGIVSFSYPLLSAAGDEVKSPGKLIAQAQKPADGGDEGAIKASIGKLARALAEGNASELASLWTEDGTYIDSDGAACKGRAALETRFREVFGREGRQMVDLQTESLKMLAPNVATAEGLVRRKDAPEGPTPETRYSIVFVKQNGNWLMANASETALTVVKTDPLKELSWMIGNWSAEQNGGFVKMKADWAANKNFITCQYETKKSPESPVLESRQVIGWDPRTSEPISWHFDSNGGFGWGNWIKKGNQWLVESTGVERDGSTTSGTNVISMNDGNNFSWQSVNRSVNGVAFNDSNPLTVHRVIK